MKFFLVLLFFTFQIGISCAQTAKLTGYAPQFIGERLLIKGIVNPITKETKVIDTLRFDQEGNFYCNIELNKPIWFFIETGIFHVTMYACPGTKYEIILPPKTKKSEADIRNPFYKPLLAHIQVKNEFKMSGPDTTVPSENINEKIFRFDTLIASTNLMLMDAIRKQITFNSDSLILSIESTFQSDTSEYFHSYRKYRYGIIKINSRDVGLQYIHDNYLNSEYPETNNPAYMDLFNEMYKEFLFYYSRTKEGKNIPYIVNRMHNIQALKDTLMKHQAVPDENLAELIILKEVFDIYTKNYFYKEALIMMLDSIIKDPTVPEHALYADGIKKKLTRLQVGERPPSFSLIDMNDELRSIEDYKGKYVYLNFCTPDNYSCLKEYPFLDAIYGVHHKYLEIVTIMVTAEIGEMKDFMKKNEYYWPCLFYGNNEDLLLDYDVKAFPSCFLIDPDGKIVLSPASLATEGFEQQLFNIMRSRGDL